MDIKRAVRLTLANLLRVIHIALWMTIPATFLSWFSGPEPSPRKCEPYCGYYQGNVLGISEDAHILIMLLLLLIGFIVWVCWVNGYCFETVRHVLAGDTKLPPIERGLMFDGFGLAWYSFRYWLPAIALAFFGLQILGLYPPKIADRLLGPLTLAAVAVALVMYWGQLVGMLRFAASGQTDLIYRRRENIRIAQKNLGASLILTGLLVGVIGVGSAVWSQLLNLGGFLLDYDPVLQAALASFAFFFMLMTCCCVWRLDSGRLRCSARHPR